MRKVIVSQIVHRKLTKLRKTLKDRFGEEVSRNALADITDAMADLGQFPEKGIDISKMYKLETDYYYLFFRHNYIIYRFDEKSVTVLQMFDEREDYMNTLFGILFYPFRSWPGLQISASTAQVLIS